jgi:DNA-binding FadR family transcriptional regulator
MLPPAAEMAHQWGVSSASLREAFRSLETLGILDTKHGVGTFIRAYDISPILDNLSFSLLFKRDNLYRLIQIREAMEVGLIPAVVAQIDEENLSKLESILDEIAHSQDSYALEIDFHRTLYRCLNNELIPQFLDIFWLVHHDLVDQAMISHVGGDIRWRTHQPIVEALKKRDANAAIHAIHQHFDGVKHQLKAVETASPQGAA